MTATITNFAAYKMHKEIQRIALTGPEAAQVARGLKRKATHEMVLNEVAAMQATVDKALGNFLDMSV